MTDVAASRAGVDELLGAPVADLGGGDTASRWLTLYEWARRGPVGLARLAEAHLDAQAICAEAGVSCEPGMVYGVWASAESSTRLDRCGATISGTKPFCSGAGVVDRALVTTRAGDGTGVWLALVDVGDGGLDIADDWTTPVLADTHTATVHLRNAPVIDVIGPDRWYLDRPGFWHGAIGPAACWAGAAVGLIDHSVGDGGDRRDHAWLVARGVLACHQLQFESLLQAAGCLADSHFDDRHLAQRRALASRHLIERGATAVADRISQTVGPRPFVADREFARRHDDLHLYLRQHHAERDLALLGELEADTP